MIISAQSLATFLEQDYTVWNSVKKARAVEHILNAGDEARGALTALYSIPVYTRDVSGVVTSPVIILDPARTALGSVVRLLAAAFLLDPARGIQPQEERSAAVDYRMSARAILKDLQSRKSFIAPIDKLSDYGITPTSALIGSLTAQSNKPTPQIAQNNSVIFGALRDPATGEGFV